MYLFLNCLSLGPAKLIKRFKLIRRRAHLHKHDLSKSSFDLHKSDESENHKTHSDDPVAVNNNQEVKLVNFSNLDMTFAKASTVVSEIIDNNTNEVVAEMIQKKEEICLMNKVPSKNDDSTTINDSTIIERVISIKDEKTIRLITNNEDISDKILHELHANSVQVSSSNDCTSLSDQICTSATKHLNDCNADQATYKTANKPDCFANEQITTITTTTNATESRNESMDTTDQALQKTVKNVETNNEQTTTNKLIDSTTALRSFSSSNALDQTHTDHRDQQLTTEQMNIKSSTQVNSNTDDKLIVDAENDHNLSSSRSELNKPEMSIGEPFGSRSTIGKTNLLMPEQTDDSQSRRKSLTNATSKTNKKSIQETDLRTNPILNGVETWIELNKGNDCALGLDLIERTINDQKLFIIHEIAEKAIADADQRLKVGDVILQVNDVPLKQMSCDEAIEHLNRTNGTVKLLIYRELICINNETQAQQSIFNDTYSANKSNSVKINYQDESTMQENELDEDVQLKVINGRLYEIIQVELMKKANKGLGLCIAANENDSAGPYISEILPNSIAEADQRLRKGDHIVKVNEESITEIDKILAMLKCLQGSITLKVARLMPGQIVSLESFNCHNQRQHIEDVKTKEIKFKVIVLNKKLQNNVILKKRKPLNDRVKELMNVKDNDSLADRSMNDCSLLDETVSNDWLATETPDDSISKNWIKVDKSKKSNFSSPLDQELADLNCSSIDELASQGRIMEIDGCPLYKSNSEQLVNKLKNSIGSTVPTTIMILVE